MSTEPFIAVGYDGSPASGAALSWAATMAGLRNEEVVATIIVDPRESPRGIAWPDSWWEEIEDKAHSILQELPEVEYRLVRHMGNKVSTLLAAGHDASMLVVGSHGHSVVGQMFLGSVSQSLARHAEQPVIVVREPRTADAGRIVVGYDGQGPAKRALEFACQTAELTGEKILVVRAWQPEPLSVDRYGYAPPSRTGAVDEQEAALEFTVKELRTAHPAIGIDGDLAVHVPAGRALVDASNSASLVVVGSHNQSAVAAALRGSVTHDVLHRAYCTVAVVK